MPINFLSYINIFRKNKVWSWGNWPFAMKGELLNFFLIICLSSFHFLYLANIRGDNSGFGLIMWGEQRGALLRKVKYEYYLRVRKKTKRTFCVSEFAIDLWLVAFLLEKKKIVPRVLMFTQFCLLVWWLEPT